MEWITKEHINNGKSEGEVYISEVCKNSKPYISIRFHRDILDKVSRTGFVKIAKNGTRLYFDEATRFDGWRLGKSSNNYLIKLKPYLFKKLGFELGSYNLEFDDISAYYYIDLTKKLEKQLDWSNR